MTTNTYANPGNCCAPKPGINLVEIITRFLTYLKNQEKRYQDIRLLNEMTDHQLRDIGLHRGDIRDAVYGRSLDQIRNEDIVRR